MNLYPAILLLLALPAVADPLLELRAERERAWPGQTLGVEVRLLTEAARLREVGYPRLGGDWFRLSDFDLPREERILREGREYRVQVFAARLTPLREGKWMLGPAELELDKIETASGANAFFGGGEALALRLQSPAVPLEVMPLPLPGRPPGFSGAVGRFRLQRETDAGDLTTGRGFTLTTRIRGPEAARWFTCPDDSAPGLRAYPPRSERGADGLLCRQHLLAEQAGVVRLPAYRIAYFDPEPGRYGVEEAPPIVLRVAAASAPALPGPAAAAVLPALPPARSWYGLGWLLPLLALGVWLGQGSGPRRMDAAPPPSLEALEQALATEDADAFHDAAHRLAQHLAARSLHKPAAGLTVADLAATPAQADLARVMAECDAARYGGGASDPARRRAMARTLRDVRDGMHQGRAPIPSP